MEHPKGRLHPLNKFVSSSLSRDDRPLLVGKRPEEGCQVARFFGGELLAQLQPSHFLNRLLQSLLGAVVEVRSGQSDVAQAGHLEDELIVLFLGDLDAALVGGVLVGIKDAQLLEVVASEERPSMAGGATNRQEGVETFELGGGQSLVITLEEVVKPVVGAQGPFERSDGLGEVVIA